MCADDDAGTPGNFEALVGQGPVTFHSEEHLRTSDRGVAMLRRLLKQQLNLMDECKDLMNVVLGSEDFRVDVTAGNFDSESGAA